MILKYRFPDLENRNRFIRLIAMNIGEYGYGFGLEFRGIEYTIEKPNGHGELISHIGNAKGSWKLIGSSLELDCTFIAMHRENFEKLRERLWEIAERFGGHN